MSVISTSTMTRGVCSAKCQIILTYFDVTASYELHKEAVCCSRLTLIKRSVTTT